MDINFIMMNEMALMYHNCLTNDIKLNDMKLLKCAPFFYRNGHASLRVVFNIKFYDVNSPILHKTYSKMAFLVDNLIINKS